MKKMKGTFESIYSKRLEIEAKAKGGSSLLEALLGARLPVDKTAIIEDLAAMFAKPFQGTDYWRIRSIVLNLHYQADMLLSMTLASRYLDDGATGDGRRLAFMLEIMPEIQFYSKINLAEAVELYSNRTIAKLKALNNLRNALAHSLPKDHPKMKYGGHSIFSEEGLEKLWRDFEEVADEQVESFTKRIKPKAAK